MQRPLALMFIVSILAATVALAEPPAHASRYQPARDRPDRGVRYGRDAHSQRPPEARSRYRDDATTPPTGESARGQAYASHAGQWRNSDRPFPGDRRNNDGSEGRDYERADNRYPRWTHDRHDWRDDRDGYARQRFSIGYYNAPWGYTTRLWACGDRLPHSYYGGRYVVDDYYNYDLYAPSYDTAWVRVGSDVLLIDMENGEVLDVVADLFW